MTLAELWELFPISLVEPDEKWSAYYDEVETLLFVAKWTAEARKMYGGRYDISKD